ncbi:MAG: HAMP domain-containing histidine kinase [Lachnospiraceae bacterium]|nr:HAMP domain-containing histidine kinase [Lachnospiraceae bacterium]
MSENQEIKQQIMEKQQNDKPNEIEKAAKKTKREKHKWIVAGICVSMVMAIVFTSFYGVFENAARKNLNSPLESEEQLAYLFNNTYVLYRDLYNKKNQTNADYADIYLKPKEGYEWLLEDATLELPEDEFFAKFSDRDFSVNSEDVEITEDMWEFYEGYHATMEYVNHRFLALESEFTNLNSIYDYLIEDTSTLEIVTNLTIPNVNFEEQFLYISFVFDENGNVSLDSNIKGNDITKLRKNANEVMRNLALQNMMESREIISGGYLEIVMPKDCKVTFCISNTDWKKMESDGIYVIDSAFMIMNRFDAYSNSPCIYVYMLIALLVLSFALFFSGLEEEKPWNEVGLCNCMPAEGLLVLAFISLGLMAAVIYLVMWVNSGSSVDSFAVFLPRHFAKWIVYGINILAITAILFIPWYMGICLRALREWGGKKYFRERSLLYQIFPYVKRKYQELYEEASHFDVTKNAKKLILKIVILNGIILFVICCFPLGGFAVALVYSVLLYFVLKKYISNLQQKYSILLGATNEIAEGNLNVSMKEDLGVFEPFKPQIIRIQSGFKKAVEEETKSQRMKSELITNVSHDLKTPLTAIITYINLLKEEDITEKQRKEYLDTLERKSMRLKVLIEDLFEVSKANSQNLTLNIMDVDIVNLLKQVSFEMNDKLKEKQLEVRMDLPEEKVILPLDSQKTYRIFENLLGNVAKYAMTSTRVYIQCLNKDEEISIIIKNISSQEILVSAEELTERFVRGDVSRNTEGSGLGLAIAKSFTELQGGKFNINLDGDLFKVTVFFEKKTQKETVEG